MTPIRAVVWGENHHEQVDQYVRDLYPEGMHECIAAGLRGGIAHQAQAAHDTRGDVRGGRRDRHLIATFHHARHPVGPRPAPIAIGQVPARLQRLVGRAFALDEEGEQRAHLRAVHQLMALLSISRARKIRFLTVPSGSPVILAISS